jgi:hypothetical protein
VFDANDQPKPAYDALIQLGTGALDASVAAPGAAK